MNTFDTKELENVINYHFKDKSILTLALTHTSYANELRQKKIACECNERLEFLGDSVVSIISSTYLYNNFPNHPEGELSALRAGAICTNSLSSFAKNISLGNYLNLGCGEDKCGGREKDTILENAFEALVGAIYLDSGCNLDVASKFLLPFITEEISIAIKNETTEDFKSRLQQIVQQMPCEKFEYIQTNKEGPDHAPMFTVEARLNSNIIGIGKGASIKKAEQAAAQQALLFFENTADNSDIQ